MPSDLPKPENRIFRTSPALSVFMVLGTMLLVGTGVALVLAAWGGQGVVLGLVFSAVFLSIGACGVADALTARVVVSDDEVKATTWRKSACVRMDEIGNVTTVRGSLVLELADGRGRIVLPPYLKGTTQLAAELIRAAVRSQR